MSWLSWFRVKSNATLQDGIVVSTWRNPDRHQYGTLRAYCKGRVVLEAPCYTRAGAEFGAGGDPTKTNGPTPAGTWDAIWEGPWHPATSYGWGRVLRFVEKSYRPPATGAHRGSLSHNRTGLAIHSQASTQNAPAGLYESPEDSLRATRGCVRVFPWTIQALEYHLGAFPYVTVRVDYV